MSTSHTQAGQGEAFDPERWVNGTDVRIPRVLHTMLRVASFEEALRFYIDGLGMEETDRLDIPSRRVTALFLGFPGQAPGGTIELARKWDDPGPFGPGNGFGHIGIGVPDVTSTMQRLRDLGFSVEDGPLVVVPGAPPIAFATDPNGYVVELIQTVRDPGPTASTE
ncbi:VOC family protein [Microbacterium immunditiarum]|uniref:Aldoketomutase n=1 Tax=Microbacterium immunditiarum TaxID=337480 RepID=A0A7Y9GRT8_9MICO|nr:VOC family protein [Microbacterium immunditiarum]NYE21512.1 lactoylglutathione lyase [Microbacterium immunditiarum]